MTAHILPFPEAPLTVVLLHSYPKPDLLSVHFAVSKDPFDLPPSYCNLPGKALRFLCFWYHHSRNRPETEVQEMSIICANQCAFHKKKDLWFFHHKSLFWFCFILQINSLTSSGLPHSRISSILVWIEKTSAISFNILKWFSWSSAARIKITLALWKSENAISFLHSSIDTSSAFTPSSGFACARITLGVMNIYGP